MKVSTFAKALVGLRLPSHAADSLSKRFKVHARIFALLPTTIRFFADRNECASHNSCSLQKTASRSRAGSSIGVSDFTSGLPKYLRRKDSERFGNHFVLI